MSIQALYDHLETAVTTTCRCWSLTRTDGAVLGFTDHDRDLSFESVVFKAETGLTARTLQQQTGLSVDNTEAVGGFSDTAITEADLMAGRYDGAEVIAWLVNWQDTTQRLIQFRGNIGDIKAVDGRFSAELRGLADRLNQPRGRAFHRTCDAVLGDGHCGFDLDTAGFFAEAILEERDTLGRYLVSGATGFSDGWFSRGRLLVLTGNATGLVAAIRSDEVDGTLRRLGLWDGLGQEPEIGDIIRIEAGCDKLAETCRTKFSNFLNFRGFPHIPGEDWLMSYPVSSQTNDGGSRIG